jgi:hypothetical protein
LLPLALIDDEVLLDGIQIAQQKIGGQKRADFALVIMPSWLIQTVI